MTTSVGHLPSFHDKFLKIQSTNQPTRNQSGWEFLSALKPTTLNTTTNQTRFEGLRLLFFSFQLRNYNFAIIVHVSKLTIVKMSSLSDSSDEVKSNTLKIFSEQKNKRIVTSADSSSDSDSETKGSAGAKPQKKQPRKKRGRWVESITQDVRKKMADVLIANSSDLQPNSKYFWMDKMKVRLET